MAPLNEASPAHPERHARPIAVGAAAILGVASLAHQNQHHKDDKHHNTPEKEAAYERGFQDGLHNADFRPDRDHESAYRDGFDAGVDERKLRTGHYRDHEWEDDRHAAPCVAMQACAGEVSDSANINPRDITPVTSRSKGDGYLVEVASGFRLPPLHLHGGRGWRHSRDEERQHLRRPGWRSSTASATSTAASRPRTARCWATPPCSAPPLSPSPHCGSGFMWVGLQPDKSA